MYKRGLAFLEQKKRHVQEQRKKQALEAAAKRRGATATATDDETLKLLTHAPSRLKCTKAIVSTTTCTRAKQNAAPSTAASTSLSDRQSVPQTRGEEEEVDDHDDKHTVCTRRTIHHVHRNINTSSQKEELMKSSGQHKSKIDDGNENKDGDEDGGGRSVSVPLQTLTANTVKLAPVVNKSALQQQKM